MKNKMKKLISNTKSPQYNNPIIIVPSFWVSAIKGDPKVKVPKTIDRLNALGQNYNATPKTHVSTPKLIIIHNDFFDDRGLINFSHF
jgi:hypothetical protein